LLLAIDDGLDHRTAQKEAKEEPEHYNSDCDADDHALLRRYSCVTDAKGKESAGPRERGLLAKSVPSRMVEALTKITKKETST
jgi:hypothetical protein